MRLIERLRIVVTGRKLSDAIKADIEALVARSVAIGRECQVGLDEAAAFRIKTLETNHLPESAASTLTALGRVLEAFDGHEIRIHQLVAEFHDAERVLVDRIDTLAGVYRASDRERARLLDEIWAIRGTAMDLHVQFLQGFMSLERLWQRWSPAEPRHLRLDASPRLRRA